MQNFIGKKENQVAFPWDWLARFSLTYDAIT